MRQRRVNHASEARRAYQLIAHGIESDDEVKSEPTATDKPMTGDIHPTMHYNLPDNRPGASVVERARPIVNQGIALVNKTGSQVKKFANDQYAKQQQDVAERKKFERELALERAKHPYYSSSASTTASTTKRTNPLDAVVGKYKEVHSKTTKAVQNNLLDGGYSYPSYDHYFGGRPTGKVNIANAGFSIPSDDFYYGKSRRK